jgi:hypothetical protein
MMIDTPGALESPPNSHDRFVSAHINFPMAKRCHEGCEERPSLANEGMITQLMSFHTLSEGCSLLLLLRIFRARYQD